MTRPMTALDTQAPMRVRQPILDILSQDLTTSNRPLGHRAPGHRSPGRDNRPLNSGQSPTEGPALVRTVTVKDTQRTPRDSMCLAQESNRDLPVAMQETALDTLSLNRGREAIMDRLSLVTDSQTLVLGEDKDLVMGTLKIPLDFQGPIVQGHPPGDTLTPSMAGQDRAREEDEKPSMSSQQTDPDTQALNTDHCPLDPGQADIRNPA